MLEKINLEEIMKTVLDCKEPWSLQLKFTECIDILDVNNICLEFGKQLLELAAKNAEVIYDYDENTEVFRNMANKQSILDVIKLIE